ncbi:retaining beta-glycosidase [Maribacter algarum]|uniref:Retaining beta-glycosidase n=1 Tax=Maribacter algarum (ex Zhang et al. 2020) TaxID=2578118 RepID=A0A5S3PVR4_9FLAO|nr:cellulase family glycosylhydrolase [Maribacter algarum]TMM58998.1 retaining beta-glycosidase [Maribacter algarum]
MKFSFLYSCLFLFFISCSNNDDAPPSNQMPDPVIDESLDQGEENTENLLLQLNGTQLVDADQNPVYLQGVAFNNFIWFNNIEPHHSEIDYQRVADMGMNAIRFYMNYRYFEDDTNPYVFKQSGWDWLDQNIEWAKKHGIYLVLNMHAPQGGYQSQGEGNALWDNVENQNRLAALWKEIAKRYKDEVQIAGFGPVNEPVPSQSMSQWNILAQRLIDDIREVNKNHIIFIEQAIYVQGNFTKDENFNFPVVSGENLIYEFHGYEPFFYSHQLLEFAGLGDGGKYPDEDLIEVDNSEWYTATFDNPSLPAGNTDWTFFEGVQYTVSDTEIALGVPALIAADVGGRAYFDDIVVKEFDSDGNFVRDVYQANLNSLDGWNFWSLNGSGSQGLSTIEGHNDTSSLYIQGTTGDSNLSFYEGRFEVKKGYSYQISGWMKGENIMGADGGKIRLDFYKVDGPLLKRNKAFLENFLGNIAEWAAARNAVLYMGEFGAGTPCFENNKGGLVWVADMVDILKQNNIHFTYHAYHEDAFGLYLGGGLPDPSNVNQPLIDWFKANLN